MSIRGKTFLITGGAGFIGSHTAKALLARGAKVVIVDNLSTGRRANVPKGARFYKMNITDRRLADVFARHKPQYVYHLAFYVLVPESTKNPRLDMDSIEGSVNVLEQSAKHKARKIIFSSSGFLYGNTRNLPAKETEPISYISPYIVSKSAVENYLKVFYALHKLPYVVLRYAAIYGPGQVTGAMADYIRQLSNGQQADIWGDGTKTRDYVFIDDVIRANLLALSVPDSHSNPVFNIGTGKETTLNALYRTIAKILNKPAKPKYLKDRKGEQMRYALDHGKITRELGWKPTVPLGDGLMRILESRKNSRS